MKLSALAFLTILLVAPASARIFTSTAGETMEAEIIQATGSFVSLQLKDGSTVRLKGSDLVPADQEFIKSWITRRAAGLQANPHFDLVEHEDPAGQGGKGRRVQILDLSVDLTLEQDAPRLAGRLKYILVGRSMEREGRYKILSVQDADFEAASGETTEIVFKAVKNYYERGPDLRKGSCCVGYVLSATRTGDEQPIYSHASTPELERSLPMIIRLQTGEETDGKFTPLASASLEAGDQPEALMIK